MRASATNKTLMFSLSNWERLTGVCRGKGAGTVIVNDLNENLKEMEASDTMSCHVSKGNFWFREISIKRNIPQRRGRERLLCNVCELMYGVANK